MSVVRAVSRVLAPAVSGRGIVLAGGAVLATWVVASGNVARAEAGGAELRQIADSLRRIQGDLSGSTPAAGSGASQADLLEEVQASLDAIEYELGVARPAAVAEPTDEAAAEATTPLVEQQGEAAAEELGEEDGDEAHEVEAGDDDAVSFGPADMHAAWLKFGNEE